MKTSKLALNSAVHPQVEEVPTPLEIHLSVDPELARGLLNAVEYIDKHPEEFNMASGNFDKYCGPQGCVICHAERLSNWKRNWGNTYSIKDIPIGDGRRIFDRRFHTENGFDWFGSKLPIARIEHFLRTGE